MSSSIPSSMLEKFTTFGDLLRFLRRRAGITQMEMATAVGYSDAQISRLEQNLRLPDIPTIEARFIPVLDLEDEPRIVARLLELAANVRREDAPVLGLCPYKGLNYFDEADADLFMGREALTGRLVERVLALASSRSPAGVRFLSVVGASGSGKSSLVRAGLVPALRWNKVSSGWDIHILTPTAHPLESLSLRLTQENNSLSTAAALMDDLLRDARSLHLFSKRGMGTKTGAHLLLVIDQFEELFTLCRSEEERAAFIGNLLNAVSEPDGLVIAIITLRADFYAHCARYLELRQALAEQQEYIGAMSDAELRRAIEEPARRGRWELEPGLVELLLHDVGHEPGALPLLSHALLETWQKRRGRTMTFSGYTSAGGVRGAIAETAEAVFTDQFTPEQKVIARRIFLRLTELGDETTAGDTRRRATFDELILKPEETATTQNVLQVLANARLIITSEEAAEVAHEALIREWPTLRNWLEENRDGLRLHRHLTEAAQDWAVHNREPDVLYRGARLAQASEWAGIHPDELNTLESEFLAASKDLANCEATERDAQRQRELDVAQRLAETERRRAEEQANAAGQLQKRSIYLAGAFALALILALAAGFLGWQAKSASRLAISRELAAASLSNLEIDPERSVLLALQAITTDYTFEAEGALHQSIMASRIRQIIQAHEPGSQLSIAYSPDGSQIAVANPDETVKIWDLHSYEILFIVEGHSVAYSPDGRRLATIGANGNVKLWNAETGVELPLAEPVNGNESVAFSPDGLRIATVTKGDLPRIWDVSTGRELAQFPGHTDYVSNAYFSPDGKQLLSTSDDGTARLWNASTSEEILKLDDHSGWVWAAAFSPDGRRIATISEIEAVLWDAASGEKLYTLAGHRNSIYAVAFSPDGSHVATGGLDRKVIIWNTASGKQDMTLSGHTGAVTSLAFNPGGTQLVTGSDDGTVRFWDLTPGREWLTISNPEQPVSEINFSPDSSLLATAEGNVVKIRDAKTGEEQRSFLSYKYWVQALSFNPDGKYLVTAGDDLKVILWDVGSGEQLFNWDAHTGRVNTLAFSPDGIHLVTGSGDYKVKLWDLTQKQDGSQTTPRLSLSLDLQTEVASVTVSQDGKTLAAGLNTGMLKAWDIDSQNEILSVQGHKDMVTSIDFSPNGRLLVTASMDGTAKVWDVTAGKELRVLGGHTNSVIDVSFNPEGTRIATASRDGTAKLWDVASGQELLTFYNHDEGLNSIAFNPAGTLLATGGDSDVQVYLLMTDDLVALARTRVTRKLTVEECQKYLHRISAACAKPVSLAMPTPLPATDKNRICQVTNGAGLYDNYFNEMIYRGVQDTIKLYSWQANVLQSFSGSDLEQNIQAFVKGGCDLIVLPGPQLQPIEMAAEANPEQKFLVMDFLPGKPFNNVWAQVYATDQAAFLAGYVAASVTRTGKVGVFGGIDIPQVTGFMDGFALGVKYFNEKNGTNVEVLGWDVENHSGLFTGGFCCAPEGRQLARQLLEQGADIILPVAGNNVGWGAGAEVRVHENAWLVGVDTDWALANPDFAGIMLTSIEKRFDASVIKVAGTIMDDAFTGGVHTGTLATGEVNISPFHDQARLVSEKTRTDLEQIKEAIIAGEIKTSP